MDQLTAVILAAGEGKRMRSRQPKVLHPLCGRPLIAYPLRAARALADRIVLVVGPNADDVVAAGRLRRPGGRPARAARERPRGPAGQAECADGTILVLPGDMPLLSVETIEPPARPSPKEPRRRDRADRGRRRAAGLRARPAPGRARQADRRRPRCHRRREEDLRDQHLRLLLRRRAALAALGKVRADNDQGEYYLTDVIGILARAGARVDAVVTPIPARRSASTTASSSRRSAAVQRRRILDRLMEGGVTILDPASTYVEDTVTIGAGHDRLSPGGDRGRVRPSAASASSGSAAT